MEHAVPVIRYFYHQTRRKRRRVPTLKMSKPEEESDVELEVEEVDGEEEEEEEEEVQVEAVMLPVLPVSVLTAFGDNLEKSTSKETAAMLEELVNSDETRDHVFRQTRAILNNASSLLFLVRTGKVSSVDSLIVTTKDLIKKLLDTVGNDSNHREGGRLSLAIEKFTETVLLLHFFSHGTLASHASVQPCNDEEYLGSVLGFAQELSRYVIGRACEFDVQSISLCRSLINQINAKMLEFDFRNGNLRRKYDGLKYVLKNIEDVTYELSLLPAAGGGADDQEAEQPSKRRKITDINDVIATNLIDMSSFDAIKVRMDVYDKKREEIIKQSRDVQKLSKQAIFSIHRGNLIDAKDKLDKAFDLANTIISSIVNEYPTLRQGAFSNSLEEWAEGAMTYEWVINKRIILKHELEIVSSHEYIGAISDFTGEIGRLAVALASKRDIKSVKEILECDVTLSATMMLLNVGGKYNKKADAVFMNLKKVENIVYDLSLLNHGGRGARERDPEPVMQEEGKAEES